MSNCFCLNFFAIIAVCEEVIIKLIVAVLVGVVLYRKSNSRFFVYW